jgi:hypothetical protein
MNPFIFSFLAWLVAGVLSAADQDFSRGLVLEVRCIKVHQPTAEKPLVSKVELEVVVKNTGKEERLFHVRTDEADKGDDGAPLVCQLVARAKPKAKAKAGEKRAPGIVLARKEWEGANQDIKAGERITRQLVMEIPAKNLEAPVEFAFVGPSLLSFHRASALLVFGTPAACLAPVTMLFPVGPA